MLTSSKYKSLGGNQLQLYLIKLKWKKLMLKNGGVRVFARFKSQVHFLKMKRLKIRRRLITKIYWIYKVHSMVKQTT